MDHGSPTGHPDPEGELRLERRVAELEQLLDNVDGIVWTGDPGGLRFRYVSRRAERLLGYPVEQWIEEPQFWLNHMHPDDREWVPSLAYSQSRVGQAHEFEFRMIAADGRTIWLRNVVTVAKQEEGGPVLRGLMIDISARKESERRTERRNAALHELARSEALDSGDFDLFTRLAIQTAADVLDVDRIGVWLFNDDRSILRCESLYERGKDRFSTGLELQAAAYPRYFAALADGRFVAADDALTDPTTSEFAESYLAPLGITSMLDAPIRRGQKLIGVVCHEHVGPARRWLHDEREFAASIAHFVSHALEARHRSRAEQDVRRGQQRLLEQKLLEKERVERELARTREHLVRQTRLSTIGQIAASIAHELRNPLGAIRNATFYLRRHVPREDPKWVKHVGIIEQEVDNADGIIGDLLEMTRAKAPVKAPVDLGEVVTAAFSRLQSERLSLDLAIDPQPFRVDADAGQLRQVFTNLLLNAAQAMDGRGTVRVRARHFGGQALVTVEDEGAGIRPEDRERVFEPLFTTKAKGTGLGLPVCRQIIEGHGGTIAVADTSSAGTRFEIRLPEVPEDHWGGTEQRR